MICNKTFWNGIDVLNSVCVWEDEKLSGHSRQFYKKSKIFFSNFGLKVWDQLLGDKDNRTYSRFAMQFGVLIGILLVCGMGEYLCSSWGNWWQQTGWKNTGRKKQENRVDN